MIPPPIPGPDPHPEPILSALPPGATDCHFHLFGPPDRFPYAEGRGYTPPDAPLEAFLALQARLGLSRGVLVQGNAHGYDNRVVLDALEREPGRLRGVAITDERVDLAELRRWDALGMRGLRFHIFAPGQGPNYRRGVGLDTLRHFAPMLRELGWHAQLFCEWQTLEAAMPALLDATEGIPLVFDHMCRFEPALGFDHPSFRLLLRLLGEGRCWMKLSGAYRCSEQFPDYPDVEAQHRAFVAANPDQVVWGSDWPHPQLTEETMPNDGRLLNLLLRWTPGAEERMRVLVANPARLYGF
ncbi:MAG TPA: amidohydrolase family protein [Roseomonas sp.]